MTRRSYDSEFKIGDRVYCKIDPDNSQGIITGIQLCPDNAVVYRAVFPGDREWSYYELELSATPCFDLTGKPTDEEDD